MTKINSSATVSSTATASKKMPDLLSGLLGIAPKAPPVRRELPQSEVLRRKNRLTGSDDAQSCANVCKFAEESGIRDKNALTVAAGVAKGMENAKLLTTLNEHEAGAKVALGLLYALKRNEIVSRIKVPCRDGRQRRVLDVVTWFGQTHMKIHKDIEAAKLAEREAAEIAAREAEAAKKRAEEAAAWAMLEAEEAAAARVA